MGCNMTESTFGRASAQIEEAAREQNREPADVVEEAVGKYLANLRLERFAGRMERRAIAKVSGKRMFHGSSKNFSVKMKLADAE